MTTAALPGGDATPLDRKHQIEESLRIEWRLKTEQGIHHDHLSDLSFLLVELEHSQAHLALARQQVTDSRDEVKRLRSRILDMKADEHELTGRLNDYYKQVLDLQQRYKAVSVLADRHLIEKYRETVRAEAAEQQVKDLTDQLDHAYDRTRD